MFLVTADPFRVDQDIRVLAKSVRRPGLEQQYRAAQVLRKPRRQDGTSGSAADNHDVEPVVAAHRATFRSLSWSGFATTSGRSTSSIISVISFSVRFRVSSSIRLMISAWSTS